MKIRTQFIISIITFAAIFVFVAVSIYVNNNLVNRLNQQVATAQKIESISRELSYLTNDYLLYQEIQHHRRWEAKFAELSKNMDALRPNNPELRVLVDQLQANRERLGGVFNSVAAILESTDPTSTEVDPASELAQIRVSWSRLEVQNQGIVFDASLIEQRLADQVEQLKKANQILILVLIGLFGVYLFANFLLISRRILRSIAVLEAGTKIIGSGNLSFTIPDQEADEIGELSRAFNRMTANLRDMTASKAELEVEIAERQKAEETIRVYAQKLEQSNKELENFAMVASHDLQEPLRKIETFGGRLKDRVGPALDETGLDYLERMQGATQRMHNMIDGLLSLSRVTSKGLPFEQVDLDEVAHTVMEDLELRIRQTGGQVDIGPLAELQADRTQMHQLLQNLIGNALKFSRPDQPPVVRVRARDVPRDCIEITVEDEGVGFDMQQASRLFQPFQRLHSRAQFDGSGIGLSICRKIVERHGGTIRAESKLDEGSRFIVTLPICQPLDTKTVR